MLVRRVWGYTGCCGRVCSIVARDGGEMCRIAVMVPDVLT